MHDSLRYMETDPIYRSYDHGTLTFSMLYAFSERYALPLSHDEVVHLKKSMLGKQPPQHGEDDWQKFANLRLFYSYMAAHPGKKLLFMGSEFGQWQEWSETRSLDWHLVQEGWPHQQLQHAVKRLNELIKAYPALYEVDDSWDGFEWLNADDSENSTLAFIRYAKNKQKPLICAFNFTPVPRYGYRVGVPEEGVYQEVFSSDSAEFGGSNLINPDPIPSEPTWWQNQSNSIQLTLPPLGATFLKRTA